MTRGLPRKIASAVLTGTVHRRRLRRSPPGRHRVRRLPRLGGDHRRQRQLHSLRDTCRASPGNRWRRLQFQPTDGDPVRRLRDSGAGFLRGHQDARKAARAELAIARVRGPARRAAAPTGKPWFVNQFEPRSGALSGSAGRAAAPARSDPAVPRCLLTLTLLVCQRPAANLLASPFRPAQEGDPG